MKQSQILELTYPRNPFSRIKKGEKICRKCDVAYYAGFEGNFCVKCGQRLGIKSKCCSKYNREYYLKSKCQET